MIQILNLTKLKKYIIREANKEFSNIDYSKIMLVQGKSVKTIAGKQYTLLD